MLNTLMEDNRTTKENRILLQLVDLLEGFALVDEAHIENEVPWIIDQTTNNIPRINGIDLFASLITPFSPVVSVIVNNINPATINGNKQILNLLKLFHNLEEVISSSSFDNVIQLLTLGFFESRAVMQ